MSLLSRIHAAELESAAASLECAVAWCHEDRLGGALFCGSLGKGHVGEAWMGRLQELSDGTWIGIAGPQARQSVSPFVARARAGQLPAKAIA